jgi:hypothetical protein
MRSCCVCLCALSFFLVLHACPIFAQGVHPSSASASAEPIQKDAAGVAILDKMLATAGWGTVGNPADLVASGTITYFAGSDSQTRSVRYKLLGTSEASTEITVDAGTTQTISNGKTAATILPDGTASRLPSYLAHSMRQEIFPFLAPVIGPNDSDVSVSVVGTRQINADLCTGVALARRLERTDPRASLEDIVSPITIWISSSTYLPVEIDSVLTSIDNYRALLHLSRTFSDYRAIQGLAIPFHQEEAIEGQRASVLDLTEVQLNTGLTDADFPVPATEGGRP